MEGAEAELENERVYQEGRNMMWAALQVASFILIVGAAFGGAILLLAAAGSFINRIGNPYDKW